MTGLRLWIGWSALWLILGGTGVAKPRIEPVDAEGYQRYVLVASPEGLAESRIKASILYALTANKWKIGKVEDGMINAFHENGEWAVNLRFRFSATEIEIRHRSTVFGKPGVNKGWIERLRLTIVERLKIEARLNSSHPGRRK